MSTYVIKKDKKDSRINFAFCGSVIEGTAKFHSNCSYDTEGLTPREISSYNKLVGMADLFNFNKKSCRLGWRMSLTGENKLELAAYLHDRDIYNPVLKPAQFICFIDFDQEFYFRIEDLEYSYKLTINDVSITIPKKDKKLGIRVKQWPFFELADKPAPHNMTFQINFK